MRVIVVTSQTQGHLEDKVLLSVSDVKKRFFSVKYLEKYNTVIVTFKLEFN